MNASFEKAVLDMLLEDAGESREVLSQQLLHASVVKREHTGVGFFTYFTIPNAAPVGRNLPDMTFGNVGARLRGLKHEAGFVLFVRKGVVSMLEGYTYDEKWPERLEGFELFKTNNKGRGTIPLKDSDIERDEKDRL